MRDDTPEIETCSLVQDYPLIPRGVSYVILTVFPGTSWSLKTNISVPNGRRSGNRALVHF